MLILYLLAMVVARTYLLLISYILGVVSYYGVLKKMGLDKRLAFVPFLAERKMAQMLFLDLRSFYQSFATTCIFLAAALYVGRNTVYGIIFMIAASIVYGIFQIHLYYKVAKSFGKGFLYFLLIVFFPFIFLPILGYGKTEFQHGPAYRIYHFPKWFRTAANILVSLLTVVEFLVLIGGVSLLSITQKPPRILVDYIVRGDIENYGNLTDVGEVVTREDALGADLDGLIKENRTRDFYFPDHSKDENVVVLYYVIGSDLEGQRGLFTVNLAQIKNATKAGSNLTFVMEEGGAARSFTPEIEDGSYGRYTVKDGKVEKVMDLDDSISMSEPETLLDFLKWAKDNYPADRYMLVFWDHGGGFTFGYGVDDVNTREDGVQLLFSSEIIKCLEMADIKFDMIGFDACLMQDIDLAFELEPYADYYLGSEETESGFGWNYALGFKELAENPGMPTEDFGKAMIGSFDPYNSATRDGEVDSSSTLSLIDLTMVPSVHEKMDNLYARQEKAILDSPDNYANISVAGNNAYMFASVTGHDLIDYVQKLTDIDYTDTIISDEDSKDLLDTISASIVCRNKNSGEGINGLSFEFPVGYLDAYTYLSDEMKTLGLDTQKSMYDDYFSIMACQKRKALEGNPDDPASALMLALEPDYTEEEWYVKGFENYDSSDAFLNIPLTETENGYKIELPKDTWNRVVDFETVVYQITDKGLRYLGEDYVGGEDEDGNPMLVMDDSWPHIGGELICYESNGYSETEDGTIFRGTTKALLNGSDNIVLHIEDGVVQGYEYQSTLFPFMDRGMQQLQPGDTLKFLFDYYDESGNLIQTEPYGGEVLVVNSSPLKMEDAPFGECDLRYYGKLIDVYQRVFTTEALEVHVDAQ